MMGYLRLVLTVLLLTAFSSVYGGDCFEEPYNVDDCRQKAKQGNAVAQAMLGATYYDRQDYKEAFKWYRKSAEQGASEAQYILGSMYFEGKGVLQDYKEATKWYRLAAEQGESSAQLNLGVMYYLGQGIPQDYVMAHMYWNLAAVSGDKGAIKGRGIVEKKMTPSQLEKAQDLAREWMRTHH